jgi:hypothetical protein
MTTDCYSVNVNGTHKKLKAAGKWEVAIKIIFYCQWNSAIKCVICWVSLCSNQFILFVTSCVNSNKQQIESMSDAGKYKLHCGIQNYRYTFCGKE